VSRETSGLKQPLAEKILQETRALKSIAEMEEVMMSFPEEWSEMAFVMTGGWHDRPEGGELRSCSSAASLRNDHSRFLTSSGDHAESACSLQGGTREAQRDAARTSQHEDQQLRRESLGDEKTTAQEELSGGDDEY